MSDVFVFCAFFFSFFSGSMTAKIKIGINGNRSIESTVTTCSTSNSLCFFLKFFLMDLDLVAVLFLCIFPLLNVKYY